MMFFMSKVCHWSPIIRSVVEEGSSQFEKILPSQENLAESRKSWKVKGKKGQAKKISPSVENITMSRDFCPRVNEILLSPKKSCQFSWLYHILFDFAKFSLLYKIFSTFKLKKTYTVKVYQHFTDTLLKNLTTDIKYTKNVSVMV